MNRAEWRVVGQQYDQPLDLTPVTEMDMVAEVAAAVGARGGFIARIVTEGCHQLRCVIIAFAVGKIWQLHVNPRKFRAAMETKGSIAVPVSRFHG